MYNAIDSFVRVVVFINLLPVISLIFVSIVALVDCELPLRTLLSPNILPNPPFNFSPKLPSEDEIEPVSNPPSFPPPPVKEDIFDVKLLPKSPVADFI